MFIRTLKYLKFNLKRSLTLFFVLFIIGNLILASFSVKSAADEASRLAKEQLGTKVTLSINIEQFRSGKGFSLPASLPTLTTDQADKLTASEYVNYYNFTNSGTADLVNATPFTYSSDSSSTTTTTASTTSTTAATGTSGGNTQLSGGFSGMREQADLSITGAYNAAALDQFTNGEWTLSSGNTFSSDDVKNASHVILISQDLATLNNLKVNDTITLTPLIRSSDEQTVTEGTATPFTIVGIFTINSTQSNVDYFSSNPASLEQNTVVIPYTSLDTITGADANVISSAQYYLKDPNDITAFENEAKTAGVDLTDFSLNTNSQQYEQMVGPIENVASISNLTIIIAFIGGAAILLLIVMMSIRERKYEIGVLMALGKSKLAIASQFLLEIVFIAIIAFGISVASGKAVATQMGNYLVNKEVSTLNNNSYSSRFGGGSFGGNMSSRFSASHVKTIDHINVKITLADVELMFVTGLGICVISIILPAQKILRQNPKRILTELES